MIVGMFMLMFIFRTVSVAMAVRMIVVMAVRVVVVMAMRMVMVMAVMVSVLMSMAMRMSVVRMTTHCYHAEQIDDQSQSTDQKKLICVHLWWIQPKDKIY